MSKTLSVTSENFQQEVLESDVPVLVDFWATFHGMVGTMLIFGQHGAHHAVECCQLWNNFQKN